MQQVLPPLKRRLWPRIVSLLFLLVLAAIAGLLAWQRVWVLDWLRLRNYAAPAAITQIATQDTMTAYAQRLLFVNHPAIETRDSFNAHCSQQAEKETAVLGCFVGDRLGIYIYDISDQRLAGIEQVTTAHEMLHQAYQRLSTAERTRINGLLQAYAATITDPALKAKLAAYQQSEPTEVVNEMHSIFGTEVADLPPALESYYQQYFSKRSQVVQYYQHYRAAFDQRNAQIQAYNQQIEALRRQIDIEKASLDSQVSLIKQRYATLQAYLHNQQVDAYNDAVPGYNALIAAYKQAIAYTNSLITQYNQLVDQVNAIAVQEQQLLTAQDSHALPAGQ